MRTTDVGELSISVRAAPSRALGDAQDTSDRTVARSPMQKT
jgi:hypothetical protein